MSRLALSQESSARAQPAHEGARVAAAAARDRAGVTVRNLQRLDDIRAAAELWHGVWERDGEPPVSADLLRALAHAGNYLSGAFAGERLQGALLGFFGMHDGELLLHSHILGVDSTARTRGVGFALKLHQRAWALEHGVERVTWTYDPLVRGNGYFNLAKLGATGVEYLEDFYGAMPDAINAGGESDRLLISWSLASGGVETALSGAAELDVEEARRHGAQVALAVGTDGGGPVPGEVGTGPLLCQVPSDIVGLRRESPDLAKAWRQALREVMGPAVARGLRVAAMSRSGWYLLA